MKREQNLVSKFNKALFSATATVLFFSPHSFAGLTDSLVLCKHNKEVRTLRLEIDTDKCRAIYTKQGVDEVIGSGQYTNSCVEIISNVRKNLEEGKWSCREVKEARVSTVIMTGE
ncbi:MAG: hypothetical protein ACXVCP_07970 [Bdellovibrio sp.]